jgi:hypothetical protein
MFLHYSRKLLDHDGCLRDDKKIWTEIEIKEGFDGVGANRSNMLATERNVRNYDCLIRIDLSLCAKQI